MPPQKKVPTWTYKKVRQLRSDLGATQEEFAVILGRSSQTVAQIERNLRVNIDKDKALATRLTTIERAFLEARFDWIPVNGSNFEGYPAEMRRFVEPDGRLRLQIGKTYNLGLFVPFSTPDGELAEFVGTEDEVENFLKGMLPLAEVYQKQVS